jgi:hypothetical protein
MLSIVANGADRWGAIASLPATSRSRFDYAVDYTRIKNQYGRCHLQHGLDVAFRPVIAPSNFLKAIAVGAIVLLRLSYGLRMAVLMAVAMLMAVFVVMFVIVTVTFRFFSN